MRGAGSRQGRTPARAPSWVPPAVSVVVGLLVVLACVGAMGTQAVRGNRTVGVQRQSGTVHDAAVDDAFYHCIAVQARSLVNPGDPITLFPNLADFVTLIKSVGSWATFANAPSDAVAQLSLLDKVRGPGTCLGTVVVAHYTTPHRGDLVRRGTGASVPGTGPPPAPPL